MSSVDRDVSVELEGGPDWLPRVVEVGLNRLVTGRLKIPFTAGQENFIFDCYVQRLTGRKKFRVSCGSTKVVR